MHPKIYQFYARFRDPHNGRRDPPSDLSAELTVFVSTVGARSFNDCIAHLHAQDCRFRTEVIDHVTPMSAAFQLMLERCETPYYVQVDEDMLLRPDAISTLYRHISGASSDVALVAGRLWDEHLERSIVGVKIFRHGIVSRYPFSDTASCEKDQVRRLQADGYRYEVLPDNDLSRDGPNTFGLHGSHYDPHSAFERYATLEGALRRRPETEAWFDEQGHAFLRRFREQPTAIDLMALLGILAGRCRDYGQQGEKDFTAYNDLAGLPEAKAFLTACFPDENDAP